jgi:hypothetical protein
VGGNKKAVTALPRTSRVQRKSPSLKDQQFEERLRIAEHIVRDLREVGYSCDLGEGDRALPLKR